MRPGDGGFSLVEALVAMAVFASAGIALIVMQAQTVRSVRAQEARTLAALVAQNILVEAAAAITPEPLGARDGAAELAGRRWPWRITVTTTLDPATHRIGVEVRDEAGGEPPLVMTAFIASGVGR